MKANLSRPSKIRVAIAEDNPLRMVGFRALLESEQDHLELQPIDMKERADFQADIVLVTERAGHSLADGVNKAKAAFPNARTLATGLREDENVILQSIALGASGYICELASGAEFARAIRLVNQGSIWAPRNVLATLIAGLPDSFPDGRASLTSRQKEVLKMLVAGRSNKEIAQPLGIEERTVKAHVAQMMRKLGARNRIALSVQAITQSIVQLD